jgi:hypothetical protein
MTGTFVLGGWGEWGWGWGFGDDVCADGGWACFEVLASDLCLPLSSHPTHAQGHPKKGIATHLEREPRRQHQHQHKLEVLVDRPEGLDGAIGVRHEKVEGGRREDLVGEDEAAGFYRGWGLGLGGGFQPSPKHTQHNHT